VVERIASEMDRTRRAWRARGIGCSVAAMKRLVPIAATLALALAAAPAAACSVGADYRMPTNLELAGHADTIVLARVVGAHQDEQGRQTAVVIRPLETIKGEPQQGDIALQGMTLASDRSGSRLSDPYEFVRPHEQAYAGACIRTVFPPGTTALFFLRVGHEGMWAPAGTAYSRWAEDVTDPQSPWVQLARLYTVAAALPREDRAPFLEDEREALLARAGHDDPTAPLARLMADDIARQLAGPAPPPPDAFEEAFRDPSEESTVDAALKSMREAAEEGD
jgi:hypothetical protein